MKTKSNLWLYLGKCNYKRDSIKNLSFEIVYNFKYLGVGVDSQADSHIELPRKIKMLFFVSPTI